MPMRHAGMQVIQAVCFSSALQLRSQKCAARSQKLLDILEEQYRSRCMAAMHKTVGQLLAVCPCRKTRS